ncbi:GNAT family N-acetyltransferase [Acutalibacter sp. 1XD8-33]|nr:GNAT family N-acetyltransferase [Acutalibacter sp. 1XD8-33]
MQELAQRAYSYLGRSPLLYMDVMEALRREIGTVAAVREDGALVYIRSSQVYLLAAENQQAAEALCHGLGQASQVAVHHLETARLLEDRLGWRSMECRAAAYLELDPPQTRNIELRALTPDQSEEVLEAFGEALGTEEIQDALRTGMLQGAYQNGRLAGTVGLYPEGGIGLLAVSPDCQGMGIDEALVAHITSWCLENDFAPFVHIPVWDEEALDLYKRMGYTIDNGSVYWLGGDN